MTEKTLQACANAKAAGIIVYTVAGITAGTVRSGADKYIISKKVVATKKQTHK